jgi:hypothetical protein
MTAASANNAGLTKRNVANEARIDSPLGTTYRVGDPASLARGRQ